MSRFLRPIIFVFLVFLGGCIYSPPLTSDEPYFKLDDKRIAEILPDRSAIMSGNQFIMIERNKLSEEPVYETDIYKDIIFVKASPDKSSFNYLENPNDPKYKALDKIYIVQATEKSPPNKTYYAIVAHDKSDVYTKNYKRITDFHVGRKIYGLAAFSVKSDLEQGRLKQNAGKFDVGYLFGNKENLAGANSMKQFMMGDIPAHGKVFNLHQNRILVLDMSNSEDVAFLSGADERHSKEVKERQFVDALYVKVGNAKLGNNCTLAQTTYDATEQSIFSLNLDRARGICEYTTFGATMRIGVNKIDIGTCENETCEFTARIFCVGQSGVQQQACSGFNSSQNRYRGRARIVPGGAEIIELE